MRFSTIKVSYCRGMHFEPTKGNKKQAEDYIYKKGAFEEKGEQIVYIVTHGDIKGAQGRRSDLNLYAEQIQEGMTPQEILRTTPQAYRYKGVLKDMYYDKRSQETPIVRPVRVHWHMGESGTGKSYERVLLSKELGEENIYYLTSFNSGAFDNYNGQSTLWIEDYRGEFRLQELLRLLDVYKAEIPARYSNIKALWNEVHITSVLSPQRCYAEACRDDLDRIEQLLRRIDFLWYHFLTDDGEYMKICCDPHETFNAIFNRAVACRAMFSGSILIYSGDENETD